MKLIKLEEAAKQLGVSVTTLKRWQRRRFFEPEIRESGIFIKFEDIEALKKVRGKHNVQICPKCHHVWHLRKKNFTKLRCPKCHHWIFYEKSDKSKQRKQDKQEQEKKFLEKKNEEVKENKEQKVNSLESIAESRVKKIEDNWEVIKIILSKILEREIKIGDVIPAREFEAACFIATSKENFMKSSEAYVMQKIFKFFEPVKERQFESNKAVITAYRILK